LKPALVGGRACPDEGPVQVVTDGFLVERTSGADHLRTGHDFKRKDVMTVGVADEDCTIFVCGENRVDGEGDGLRTVIAMMVNAKVCRSMLMAVQPSARSHG